MIRPGHIRIATTLLLLAVCTTRAHAVEDFSQFIRDELQLSAQPACDFCHTRKADGLATDAPFGEALKKRGFARKDGVPSLRQALRSLDELGVDSDGDGVGDVEELRAEADPNDATDAGRPRAAGCSLARAGLNSTSALPATLMLAIAASLGSRRRRRLRER